MLAELLTLAIRQVLKEAMLHKLLLAPVTPATDPLLLVLQTLSAGSHLPVEPSVFPRLTHQSSKRQIAGRDCPPQGQKYLPALIPDCLSPGELPALPWARP